MTEPFRTTVDLTTTYLGLTLKNPLVASASPLSKKIDSVRRLADAGIAAVVLYSLFEEQITHESRELDHYLTRGTNTYAEALSYFPDLEHYNIGPEPYLEHLQRVKQAVDIPVIGSLNGVSTGGWVEYAQRIEAAGADALELNIYYLPIDPEVTSAELEESYLTLVRDVRAQLRIPIALKLSPSFTALPNIGFGNCWSPRRQDDPAVDFGVQGIPVGPDRLHLSTTDRQDPSRAAATARRVLVGRMSDGKSPPT